MKDTVLKLAVQIRERIKDTPPEIIEVDSKLILMDMARTLCDGGVISYLDYIKMMNEITELYNV